MAHYQEKPPTRSYLVHPLLYEPKESLPPVYLNLILVERRDTCFGNGPDLLAGSACVCGGWGGGHVFCDALRRVHFGRVVYPCAKRCKGDGV